MPENTIPAFERALELGVTTLEMDVVVSKDKKVVVSHDPYLSSAICLASNGDSIPSRLEKKYNLYAMDYDSIKTWDCGSKYNKRFPQQLKQKAYKPTLEEVITVAEGKCASLDRKPVAYNIELKSRKGWDDKYHPNVKEFSDLVYEVLKERKIENRVVIQSFDMRILRYWKETYPNVTLALLVEKSGSPERHMREIGFKPEIYSSNYKYMDKNRITRLKENGIAVVPWTVNDVETMKNLISWDVNGIITDYPDRLVQLAKELNITY